MESKLKPHNLFEPKKYSNKDVYKMIKYVITEHNLTPKVQVLNLNIRIKSDYERKLAVSYLMKQFTDDYYLKIMIRFLKQQKLLLNFQQAEQIISDIDYGKDKNIKQVKTVVKANIYSLIFEYETIILNSAQLLKEIPILKVDFKNNQLLHNLQEIEDTIRKTKNIKFSEFITSSKVSNKEETYKKLIDFRIDYNYTYDSSIFKKEIDFFNSKKNNLDNEISENKYPRIFTSGKAYKIFNTFINKSNVTKSDYSFIFRIMQKDNLIYDTIRNTEYKEWLNEKFSITLEKVKTLNDSRTDNKQEYYQSIKD
jgi:hypothetical protein